MIDVALAYIKDSLNQHLKNEFINSNAKVVLSNLVNADGSVAKGTEGNLVLFLVGLNEESSLKNTLNRSPSASSGAFAKKQAPLHLNLQLMICANFIELKYVEGLTYLSSIVRFFQANKKIAPDGSNEKIDKLTFDLCKLDYGELSHLWSAIGSKMMPSLVYKVGMLVFDDAKVTQMIEPIKDPDGKFDL
jgi:hypothetical protein